MIGNILLRSAGFRFAVIYAALLVASAFGLAFFLWWSTAGLLDRQTEAAIQTDAESLWEHWLEDGMRGLVTTIEDRVAQNIDDDAIYLLVDPQGRRVAGNLERWPTAVAEVGQVFELQLQRAGMRSMARVQRFDVPNGYHLLIGRDIQLRLQLRALLKNALLWAVTVVAVMAAIGGLVVRNLFRRALHSVSVTAAAIAAGDLAQRVRHSGRGDEFDQLADVINDMLDRISRLMDGVKQVSNAIAHDLRTPITRARTRLEDALLHSATREELQAAIERATADLDDIVRVFQALMRISEIEAGSRRSSFARIDLAPLLRGVEDMYGVVAEERDIALAIDVPNQLNTYGDAALIQQAVANLVDNAIKFSPNAATVRLSAVVGPTGIDIVVADQGPGIPKADVGKATERFFRGETARSTPGAGLGLSLVQAVAQLHGGALRLEDGTPGLRAVLFLPQADDAT